MYLDFSYIYDELMDDVDYKSWVLYIEEIIKRNEVEVNNILELACGTGNITIPLLKKGYDILGIDMSTSMLSVAKKKAKDMNLDLVLLNQDIVELDFDVYNLDCVLCCCDGFNYILEKENLSKVFDDVYSKLKKGGIFIFDISSYYKLKNILADNTFYEERENIDYIWENYFDEEDQILQMNLNFFVKEGELYKKFSEEHLQRAYKKEEILNLLEQSKFNDINIYSDFTFDYANDSQRIFFVAKK
ncbi:class I SAM-dependent methyltransferase [Peptostreptococcaceae bacterium AGR-M142]